MLVRKCDICGAEIRRTIPRYRIIFSTLTFELEKDVCTSCFERISDEIEQANASRTERSK